jgi:hypothetical protein
MEAMDDDPAAAVHRLLVDGHGVPAHKVTLDARIVHDLGVDGDDAAELFEDLHRRFGTDFGALEDQWREFFNTEGASPRSILYGIPAVIIFGAVAGNISAVWRFPKVVAVLLALCVLAAASWLLSRWFGKELRPLTVGGLSQIVEAGRWPADPGKVR